MRAFCHPGDISFQLLEPHISLLPSFQTALRRGWSPDNTSDSAEELRESQHDPDGFIAHLSDAANRDVTGRTVALLDGSQVPRLPKLERWIWDGEFAGRIGLR
jgi:hypothetical protein